MEGDLCGLAKVEWHCYLIACIDYFNKCSSENLSKDKIAPTPTQFVQENICRQGCIAVEISGHGRNLINDISYELHRFKFKDSSYIFLK